MRVLKSIVIASVILGGLPRLARASNNCNANEMDLLDYYQKDTKEQVDYDSRSPKFKETVRKAKKRCAEIDALFQDLKTVADFDQLAAASQKLKAMQPAVHPQDKNDQENTFTIWVGKIEGSDAKAVLDSYSDIKRQQDNPLEQFSEQQKPDVKGKEWRMLTRQQQQNILKQNEEVGKRMAQSVANIQAVNNKFAANLGGQNVADSFKHAVENSGRYGQGAPAEPGVVVNAGAGSANNLAAGGRPPQIHLDEGITPAPPQTSGTSAPGDNKNPIPPIVPVAGLGLMGVSAIGMGYAKYKQSANAEADSAMTQRHLDAFEDKKPAESPVAQAVDPAPAQRPPSPLDGLSSDQKAIIGNFRTDSEGRASLYADDHGGTPPPPMTREQFIAWARSQPSLKTAGIVKQLNEGKIKMEDILNGPL